MPNANYIKGVAKERRIVNEARELGLISFRSAGSHSPIDVVIINFDSKIIQLIQCKPDTISKTKKAQLEAGLSALDGTYTVWTGVR